MTGKPTGKTITAAQMAWNLKRGFCWWETEDEDWRLPIWSRDGFYLWDVDRQVYEQFV